MIYPTPVNRAGPFLFILQQSQHEGRDSLHGGVEGEVIDCVQGPQGLKLGLFQFLLNIFNFLQGFDLLPGVVLNGVEQFVFCRKLA